MARKFTHAVYCTPYYGCKNGGPTLYIGHLERLHKNGTCDSVKNLVNMTFTSCWVPSTGHAEYLVPDAEYLVPDAEYLVPAAEYLAVPAGNLVVVWVHL